MTDNLGPEAQLDAQKSALAQLAKAHSRTAVTLAFMTAMISTIAGASVVWTTAKRWSGEAEDLKLIHADVRSLEDRVKFLQEQVNFEKSAREATNRSLESLLQSIEQLQAEMRKIQGKGADR